MKKSVLLIRLPGKVNASRVGVALVRVSRLGYVLVPILDLFVTIIHRVVPYTVVVVQPQLPFVRIVRHGEV